jgi:hypothetical protein
VPTVTRKDTELGRKHTGRSNINLVIIVVELDEEANLQPELGAFLPKLNAGTLPSSELDGELADSGRYRELIDYV